jgi:pimeloyl-ACP methyl ester carboxylesterase
MSFRLPPFLRSLSANAAGLLPAGDNYSHAVFHHSEYLGSAHAIWWSSELSIEDSTVILFIPGNPGLCSFYISFLSEIHAKASNVAILAHSHLGHTPATINEAIFCNPHMITLESQVKSAIEAFDAIQYSLRPKRVVLISHSIGGWIAMQVA